MFGGGGAGSNDDSRQDVACENEKDNPTDTISCIRWMPGRDATIMSVGSWDGKFRFYEVVAGNYNRPSIQLKGALDCTSPNQQQGGKPIPILASCWKTDGSMCFYAGADGLVRAVDLATQQSGIVAKHDRPIKEMFWLEAFNCLMTLGLDKMIYFWSLKEEAPAGKFDVGYKIYAADFNHSNQKMPLLLMGLSDERIVLQDMSKMAGNFTRFETMESPLGPGSQLTCVSLFPNGKGMGLGTFDGRANLSQIMRDYQDKCKLDNIMTFKCHKVDREQGYNNKQQLLYPVHSIGFHNNSDKFVYTAGGEGIINYWDYGAKNKIKQFAFNDLPVTAVRLNDTGSLMAYGLGYDWARGIEGLFSAPKTRLHVHVVQESELKYVETGNTGGGGGGGGTGRYFK